jgi:hypothetical protein
MKLKKTRISSRRLRTRVTTSFFLGALLFLASVTVFYEIKSSREIGGTPRPLRNSFLRNEKLWSILYSPKKVSVPKTVPAPGKVPRVNGLLGLRSKLPVNYKVLVESGENKIEVPLEGFKIIPKTLHATEFHCIEGWSEDLQYGGARFKDFMDYYGIGKKKDGSYYQYVGFETPDKEYYVSIDMASMLHDQTVLAYEMNQRPLSLENGAPIRLIIPLKYGIKSLKRIGRIFFSDSRPKDYWAERGYDWYSGL